MTKTSPLKNSINRLCKITNLALLRRATCVTSSARGFTMVEIMVTVGIIAAVIAVGLPRLNRTNNNMKTVARELSLLGKEVRNYSRMKNMTHRIVLEMNEQQESSYWVEAAPGSVPARISTEKEEDMNDEEKAELQKKMPFQKSTTFFKKDKVIPASVRLKLVETATQPEAITSGRAYIYFMPEGLVEKSVIQLEMKNASKEAIWSVIYHPLTGNAEVIEKAITLKEVQNR